MLVTEAYVSLAKLAKHAYVAWEMISVVIRGTKTKNAKLQRDEIEKNANIKNLLNYRVENKHFHEKWKHVSHICSIESLENEIIGVSFAIVFVGLNEIRMRETAQTDLWWMLFDKACAKNFPDSGGFAAVLPSYPH